MPSPVPALALSDMDRQQVQQWVSAFGTPQQVVLRCRIVLGAAAGQSENSLAQQLKTNRNTVRLWRARFTQQGAKSLWEIAPGRGRKPTYGGEKIQAIIYTTLQSKPQGRSPWSCRSLAKRMGVSKSTVNNIWRSHQLKPHRVKSFKLSRDPHFLEKLTDVVGLYLNPPEQAIVLCVDEKSQIQALDRTQPGLPMKKGRCGTMTHDYKRNGTTTLFAALEVAQGKVIGQCMPRHRHREFLRFLKTIDERTLPNLDLHLIVDNYATHKTPAVKRWLKRHSRFHLHFTPTSGSWLNMVERFFAKITRKRIRRGVFKSVDEMKQAIMDYLNHHNGSPKPYVWTKTAAEIFSKVARAKQALESQH